MSEIADFINFIISRIGAAEVVRIIENAHMSTRYLCPNCKTIIAKGTYPCPECGTPLRWF
jgi:predicted RNA-binding Zn-ribbon protein involved in translation (DUF1610 family)